jgi:hypothetical protein
MERASPTRLAKTDSTITSETASMSALLVDPSTSSPETALIAAILSNIAWLAKAASVKQSTVVLGNGNRTLLAYLSLPAAAHLTLIPASV